MFDKIEVKIWTTSRRRHLGGELAAGLMLALWLLTFTLVDCSQIHELLPHDALSATHI
jgi:hypothetical protein